MGISFIAAATSSHVFATSLNKALPSGIADDDGVFAFVAYRGTLTPPAGWTLVTSVSATGAATQLLALYRKDTVVSADSGANQTWAVAVSDLIGVNYAVVRADSGVVVVRETATGKLDNSSSDIINVEELTADRSDEIQLIGAGTVFANNSSGFTPTPPLGTTLYSGTSLTGYRCMAARMDCLEGQYVSGTFDVIAAGVATNAITTITVRLSDQSDGALIWDTVQISLTEDTSGSTYNLTVSDGFDIRGTLGDLYSDALADVVTLGDAAEQAVPQRVTIADTFRVTGALTPTRRPTAVISDTITVGSELSSSYGMFVLEGIRLTETVLPIHQFSQALTDAIAVSDQIRAGEPVTLSDTIGLALTSQTVLAVHVLEQLGLTGAVLPATTYNLAVTDQIQLADTLRRFLGVDVVDSLLLTDAMVERYRALVTLSESIELQDTVTPQLIIRIEVSDTLQLADDEILNAIYTATLAEEIEISGGFLSPDGGFNTWTMNTRTGSITEYSDFVYNSFVDMDAKYLGLSESGLYELNGDTDDGADIVARLKGGFLQFGGGRLSRLKAAYLAARGEGVWVLKVIEGSGNEYVYQIDNRNMRSSKFHMGKGQRARFFAWELTTTGHDFDLESLEFVPLVVKRRV